MYIKLKRDLIVGKVNHPEGAHLEVCDVRGKALVKEGVARRTIEPPPAPGDDAPDENAGGASDDPADDDQGDDLDDEDDAPAAAEPEPEPIPPAAPKGRRSRKES